MISRWNKLQYKTEMKTIKAIILSLLLISAFPVFAQQKITVKGTVVDSSGEPLPGVAVMIHKTKTGSVTDIDGKYEIKVPSDASLQFVYLGYEDVVEEVKGRSTINITMTETAMLLDAAMVNVGYGSVRKSDLTGALSSVTMSDLAEQSKASLENMLQGRMAGVQVISGDGTPGGGMSVKIRGAASITASVDPLYVIDGFPYISENTDQSTTMAGNSGSLSPLAMINPNDIESIEVLKDASATAIYGSRAANGVVLITTKVGSDGKPRISYSGSYGVQQITRTMEMLSQADYLRIIEAQGQTEVTNAFYDDTGFIREDLQDPKAYIDWQDLIFRLGHKTEHQVSMSGGSKSTKYTVSLGLYDEDGIIINSDFTRLSGRINLDTKVNDWFTVGTRSSINYINNNGQWSGGGKNEYAGTVFKALKYRPINMNPSSEDFDPGEMIDEFSNNTSNPLVFANDIVKRKTSSQVLLNGYLKFRICKGLELQITGGAALTNARNSNFYPAHTDIGRLTAGRAEVGSVSSINWNQENILSYNFSRNKHSFNATAAFSMQSYEQKNIYIDVRNFQSEINGADDISMATDTYAKSTNYKMFNTVSVLGRINYNYANRYYVTASYRQDGSSRFGDNNKWAGFPSVALAWRPTQERFMEPLRHWLYSMKIRTSYGWTGNQNINPYSSLPLLGPSYYSWGDSAIIGYVPNSWGNDNLKWETTKQMDAGIDLEFFKGRFNITYDYYSKRTEDMLLSMRVPTTSGYGNRLANIGSIRQWGHELSISGTPFNSVFRWEIGLNLSFENNSVLSLGNDMSELVVGQYHKVVPGMPLGTFYGWEYDGLYQAEHFDDAGKLLPDVPYVTGFSASHRPGDMKFKDLSGPDGKPDGVVNEYDRVPIGNASPLFYGGLMNNFRYRNFELKVFMNFSYGNDVYNTNMERFGVPLVNQLQNYFARVADYWTPENTDTDIPRLCPGNSDKSTNTGYAVDYFLEDASFLRISNITLGYSIPKKALSKIKMSGIKVYASVDNAWVFTKYSGYDPEVSLSSNPMAPGLDANPYPRARVYKVGLNINF